MSFDFDDLRVFIFDDLGALSFGYLRVLILMNFDFDDLSVFIFDDL